MFLPYPSADKTCSFMKDPVPHLVWFLAGLFATAPAGFAQTSPPRLAIVPPESNGWVRVSSPLASNSVLTLEASSNLPAWQRIATIHDALRAYPDLAAPNFPQRFYRVAASARTPTNDWKNQLLFPEDDFRSAAMSSEDVRWVKFTILFEDTVPELYQHST